MSPYHPGGSSMEATTVTSTVSSLVGSTTTSAANSSSSVLDNDFSATGKNSSTFSLLQLNLSDWQRSKLIGISPQGIRCYLHSWMELRQNPIEGSYCDVAWDEIYCWPATRAGENVSRLCSQVMKDDPEIPHPEDILGSAFRICKENGTWEWNGWTNYNECIEALEASTISETSGGDLVVVNTVRYIFFVGSVLSFACILTSLLIFYYFKSLRCDRITVQIHLMLALLFRFLLMIVISEPFVFQRTNHYRSVDWICKTVMALQMYATVASISWMFVQGHYLHARVTTNVFDRGTPFKAYFVIGWGVPVILILIWVGVMEEHHQAYCWRNYAKLDYIWIVVGPMILALVVNLLFLINIMRILLTKIQLATISSDSTQFRRAVKATVVLFPLLGANNLLFWYNPGGEYEAAYMITNAIFQASQGIMVATLYCFLSKEVQDAIRREYRRFSVKRSAATDTGARSFSIRDRRRSGRFSSFYGNHTVNSVYCCEPTAAAATTENTLTAWHSFHRRASSIFSRTRKSQRPSVIRIKSITGSKQVYSLNSCNNHLSAAPLSNGNGHHMSRGTSTETTSFLSPT